MDCNTIVHYLNQEQKEAFSVQQMLYLVDNVDEIVNTLEEDGYRFGEHFDYKSILEDLLPEFMEDMDIVAVVKEPSSYIKGVAS